MIDNDARTADILTRLWDSARIACRELEALDPDLVLVLYHSGQAMLHATRAAWAVRHGTPFPPVAGINLGREKTHLYATLRETLCQGDFVAWNDAPEWTGHVLAWAADQPPWQAQLRAQARAALGREGDPARVLILDDFEYDGGTGIVALGVVSATFPSADVVFRAGSTGSWQYGLGWRALIACHPEMARTLQYEETGDLADCARYREISRELGRVVQGTEDVAPDSLDWRPLSPENPHVEALAAHVPVATVLALSGLVYAGIARDMQHRAADPAAWAAPYPPVAGLVPVRLSGDHLALREAWRRGRLTRREVVAMTGWTPRQASRFLRRWTDEGFLVRTGRGGGTAYTLRPTTGILAYGPLLDDPGFEIAEATVRRIPVRERFSASAWESAKALTTNEALATSERSAKALTTNEVLATSERSAKALTTNEVLATSERSAKALTTNEELTASEAIATDGEAQVWVMRPDFDPDGVRHMLYRRVIHKVGEPELYYDAQPEDADPVHIETLEDFAGLPDVIYVTPATLCKWRPE